MVGVQQVKDLRERTGAGMLECKRALEDANGDMEKALRLLRERGAIKAAQKTARVAREGLIEAYVHTGGKIGVLVEINCETDFVARTEEFKQFAHEIAMQVAARSPKYISRDDVPEEVLKSEREILASGARAEGKPEAVIERIVAGRLEKFFQENCLLDQQYIRDESIKIGDLLKQKIAKFGENVVIRRFARFALGEVEG